MKTHSCPTHPETELLYVLKGGAGYCVKCGLYLQALGVEMPTIDRPLKPRKAKARRKDGKSQKLEAKIR